jgi:hypothetical protein
MIRGEDIKKIREFLKKIKKNDFIDNQLLYLQHLVHNYESYLWMKK